MSAALRLDDVHYRYPDGDRPALDGVSLHVGEGELVLLLGESGCGKSTLLRAALGLVPHFHGGELAGRVVTAGLDTREHRPAEVAAQAGLVFQDPEAQLVMRQAGHEVAFGLENLGCPPQEIETRAASAMAAAGASHLAERESGRLSGGEQQRVAIASVLAMGQRLLLLDEPTSQLDPVAAEELLALVTRINRDRGITVVVAEHRTSRIFSEADRVVVMEAGRIVFDGPPPAAAAHLAGESAWLLPPVTQAFAAARRPQLPLTVRDARRLAPPPPPRPAQPPQTPAVVSMSGVQRRYGDIEALRGATTGFDQGRVTALVGENGAGKSTLARIAAGLVEPDGGRVERHGLCGYVSQNPAHHAIRERVDAEVAYALENLGVAPAERERRVRAELERFGLDGAGGAAPARPLKRRAAAAGDRLGDRDAAVAAAAGRAHPRHGRAAQAGAGGAGAGPGRRRLCRGRDHPRPRLRRRGGGAGNDDGTRPGAGRSGRHRAARPRRLLRLPGGPGAGLRNRGRGGGAASPRAGGRACLAWCW